AGGGRSDVTCACTGRIDDHRCSGVRNIGIKHPSRGCKRQGGIAMKRLGSLLGMLTVAVFAGGVLTASPAGARATTETVHVTNFTETSPDINPCTAATGTVTQTYSDVFHRTELPNGTSWFPGTLHAALQS